MSGRRIVGIGLWMCLTAYAYAKPLGVECHGGFADAKAIQKAIDRGGAITITGTCDVNSSTITIRKPVQIEGGAVFLATSTDPVFVGTSDDITFKGMTFDGAGLIFPGPHTGARRRINLLNNTFRNFVQNAGPSAALEADMIVTDSNWTGNTFQNMWLGGFRPDLPIEYVNKTDGRIGVLLTGGLDNTRIEYNTFHQISDDGLHLFANGNDSKTGGYTGAPSSISYNTFTLIHRMGMELQGGQAEQCAGGCAMRNDINAFKVAGNYYHTPAYPGESWGNTYAISFAINALHALLINNSAIGDIVGNPTPVDIDLGYAIEAMPGWGCGHCGGPWNAIYRGNVIASDDTGKNPGGWGNSFQVYDNPEVPNYFENNLMCGPPENTKDDTQNKNDIFRYNFKSPKSCPAGSGPRLYTSNIQASFRNPDKQSFAAGISGTWTLGVVAISLPVRYVDFFVDNGPKMIVRQEVQDVNTDFASDRTWLYHASVNTSGMPSGTHKLTAVITDVSGATKSISQSFTVMGRSAQ